MTDVAKLADSQVVRRGEAARALHEIADGPESEIELGLAWWRCLVRCSSGRAAPQEHPAERLHQRDARRAVELSTERLWGQPSAAVVALLFAAVIMRVTACAAAPVTDQEFDASHVAAAPEDVCCVSVWQTTWAATCIPFHNRGIGNTGVTLGPETSRR